jgi:hypothetical protein
MCYIVESKQGFDFDTMTGSIERIDMDIGYMKIWITANYDFLSVTHSPLGDNVPFQFDAEYYGNYINRVRFRETIVKPLNCKTSDTEYVSGQQCLVNMFIDENFSPCPIKCLPIQMKGFQYVNKSTSLMNYEKIEDEICNAGSKVWNKLYEEFQGCLKPCKIITYKDSKLDICEPIYDTNDVIGAIGGSLGLILGFSFFDVISKCLDNLIIPLINYLVSSR